MGSEKTLRIVAVVLIIGVVVVSYMRWQQGSDDAVAAVDVAGEPATAIVAEAVATDTGPAPAVGGVTPDAAQTTEGSGEGAVEDGEEVGEEGEPPQLDKSLPVGGGFAKGEAGKSEGDLNVVPKSATGEPPEVCWSDSSVAGGVSYTVSGSVVEASGLPAPDRVAVVVINKSIKDWTNGAVLEVHGAGAAPVGEFQVKVSGGSGPLYVCAVANPTFNDYQSFMVAGCSTKPVSKSTTDVQIQLVKQKQQLVVIGGTRFGPDGFDGARTKRSIEGKISAPGIQASGFIVAASPTPLLEEDESSIEPSAIRMAGSSGKFSLNYFSSPKAPLHVCAMAYSGKGKVEKIEGIGCSEIDVPHFATAEGMVEIADVLVKLEAEKESVDAADKKHFALIKQCLASS